MKRRSFIAAAFALAALVAAGAPTRAQPILYRFTGLPGNAATCRWFDDDLNADRSVAAMTRQTDLLYNRIALPAGRNVNPADATTTAAGDTVVDYGIGSRTICSTAEAIYGPTPSPSSLPSSSPAPSPSPR